MASGEPATVDVALGPAFMANAIVRARGARR